MITHRVLVLSYLSVLFAVPARASTNFTQCITNIQSSPFNLTDAAHAGARDNHGNIVAVANATAITYDLCKSQCGTGPEPFVWTVFSSQFSAWLLPWLALVSQLPFGSQLRTDDVMSVLLTVGSPMLAAYSLAITVLNGHWVSRKFAGIRYPNVQMAWRILSTLQQSALRVDDTDGMLASLILLPENDEWWEELAHNLDYAQTWSASAVSQIAWVVIAYLFTVIDSFTDVTNSINSNGQSVGSTFLWLLPIVIGWLQVSPKSDYVRVHDAVNRANGLAFHATENPALPIVLASEVTSRRAFMLTSHEGHTTRRDEDASAPIYNYARALPWSANVQLVTSVFRAAADKAADHIPVNPYSPWKPGAKGKPMVDDNRRGSLDQVRRYVYSARGSRVGRMDPDFIRRVIVASILGLFLQWGTVGGAVVAVWYTPTTGLGCRSGSYILYALMATAIWGIMISSSFLSFYATTESQSASSAKSPYLSSFSALVAGRLSIALRRLGKLLAAFNAAWIVLSCVFQFSSFYDRCYCNSSVLGRGKNAYNVLIFLSDDVSSMKSAWIGSIVLALGTATLFEVFIYLHINPPAPVA